MKGDSEMTITLTYKHGSSDEVATYVHTARNEREALYFVSGFVTNGASLLGLEITK